MGAGDIAVCGSLGTQATAALLDGIAGIVFTSGDNAYPGGTRENFQQCYHPTWGRHLSRTRPAPGNHDYDSPSAFPYFEYFGANAGPAGLGYYSFTVGTWHVVSLNSNVAVGEGSAQLDWLRQDLARSPARCLGAIWHHPLFSSGPHGGETPMRDIWRTLMQFSAEIVINGHDHLYERFGRLDDRGQPNPAGIQQFTVGTGGAALYDFLTPRPGSEARASTWGVLKLTLLPDSYEWAFIPVPGSSFRDEGTQGCR